MHSFVQNYSFSKMKSYYILFDGKEWTDLLPLTYTRPVAKLRIGMMTIEGRWKLYLNEIHGHITQDYLSLKYPVSLSDDNTFINGSVIASQKLAEEIKGLGLNSALAFGGEIIAARLDKDHSKTFKESGIELIRKYIHIKELVKINKISFPWELFQKAGQEMITDFPI